MIPVQYLQKWFKKVFDLLLLMKVWDAPTLCSWLVEAARLLSMTSDLLLMAAEVTQRRRILLSMRYRRLGARLWPTTTQLKRATSW